MTESFLVPPFSVFDTGKGYWQGRKKEWLSLGIESEIGRDKYLLGRLADIARRNGMTSAATTSGTSIFDPVLAEIMYKWFCVDGGAIYDPFAGGSVRGIVAQKLGYDYTGIDLREDQIRENERQAAKIGVSPTWYCDDSLNADKYISDESMDMIFSCPPYADLEVYSDDPRDISTMDYPEFIDTYRRIIEIALRKLKPDRFAVFVVGDVRDKRGIYRDFISDTKKIFIEAGAGLYNEAILKTSIVAAAMCARGQMKNRKLVRIHQHVLVFYLGDVGQIQNNYGEVEIGDLGGGE